MHRKANESATVIFTSDVTTIKLSGNENNEA